MVDYDDEAVDSTSQPSFKDTSFRKDVSRHKVYFKNELQSLVHHSNTLKRPFLGHMV